MSPSNHPTAGEDGTQQSVPSPPPATTTLDPSPSLDECSAGTGAGGESGLVSPASEVDGQTADADQANPCDDVQFLRGLSLLERLWPRQKSVPETPGADTSLASVRRSRRDLGRFQLGEELGRGGFGVVYRAFDPLLKREVALKIPHPERLASPEAMARFVREMQAAARCRHSHLVGVLEAGIQDGLAYAALEYCAGPNLADWLTTQRTPVSAFDAARLMASLADAVAAVHQLQMLHRDIKPANILLQPSDPSREQELAAYVPRLTDFGLAKLALREGDEAITVSGMVLGTPEYCSPEQLAGDRQLMGVGIDIYSLGATLYQLLTGRPPFVARDDRSLFVQVMEDEVVDPRVIRPALPRDLWLICQKCLEKSPVRRYRTALELNDDLRRFIAGEPIAARPVSPVRRIARWCHRHSWITSFAVFSVVFFGIAAMSLFYHAHTIAKRNVQLEDSIARERRLVRTLEASVTESARRGSLLEHRYVADRLRSAASRLDHGEFLGAFEELNSAAELTGKQASATFGYRFLLGRLRQERFPLVAGRGQSMGIRARFLDNRDLVALTQHEGASIWNTRASTVIGRVPVGGHEATDLQIERHANLALFARFPEGLTVWNLRTHQCVQEVTKVGRVDRVCSLPQSRSVLCAQVLGESTRLFRVQLSDGTVEPLGEIAALCESLVSSQDGECIVFASMKGTWLLDGAARPVTQVPFKAYAARFLNRDQHLVLGGSAGEISIWNREPLGELRRFKAHAVPEIDPGTPAHHLGYRLPGVTALALSPDGDVMATGGTDGAVRLYDTTTWKMLDQQTGFFNSISDLEFSPDGSHLAVADESSVFWLLRPQRQPLEFAGHDAEVWSVAFSPDGQTLATGADDHQIRLWDVATGRLRAELSEPRSLVSALAFSPSGGQLAAGCFDRRVLFWDLNGLRLIDEDFSPRGAVRGLEFSRDGQTLFAVGDDRRLWKYTGMPAISVHELGIHKGKLRDVAISPDSSLLATVGNDKLLTLRETGSRAIVESFTHPANIEAVAFSIDGSRIVTGDVEGVCRVWQRGRSEPLLTMRHHLGAVRALAAAPDRQTLASAGDDRLIHLWDLETGAEMFRIAGHTQRVNALEFSPDGTRLASVGHDGSVKVWLALPE